MEQCSNTIWWSTLKAMQVAPSGGQICKLCKWRHLVVNIATNASGAILWPNLQLMQVAPSSGQFATNASGAIWWSNLQLMQVAPSG